MRLITHTIGASVSFLHCGIGLRGRVPVRAAGPGADAVRDPALGSAEGSGGAEHLATLPSPAAPLMIPLMQIAGARMHPTRGRAGILGAGMVAPALAVMDREVIGKTGG